MRHSHIVSSSPGRTRIRLSPALRDPQKMQRIAKRVRESSKVQNVRMNQQTGSITLHHQHGGFSDIRPILEDMGVILSKTTDMPDIPVGKSRVASSITDAVSDLNRRLGLSTDGLINLRALVPLGLGTLSVVQLVRRGLEIEVAPWYVLAYAAFDSFVKLHYTREMGTEEEE